MRPKTTPLGMPFRFEAGPSARIPDALLAVAVFEKSVARLDGEVPDAITADVDLAIERIGSSSGTAEADIGTTRDDILVVPTQVNELA
ncbi:hypothetical protein [Methylobacterium sp. WL12]|uniref:hypothetical protein n=2 Tax=unclassified Methylobacterium TaxID=2615210 RepID=UPI0011C8C635|nr:hypothetical protein [Methylobacterium sp. WL12]